MGEVGFQSAAEGEGTQGQGGVGEQEQSVQVGRDHGGHGVAGLLRTGQHGGFDMGSEARLSDLPQD